MRPGVLRDLRLTRNEVYLVTSTGTPWRMHFVRAETRTHFDLTDSDGRAWEVRKYQDSQGGSGLGESPRLRIGP